MNLTHVSHRARLLLAASAVGILTLTAAGPAAAQVDSQSRADTSTEIRSLFGSGGLLQGHEILGFDLNIGDDDDGISTDVTIDEESIAADLGVGDGDGIDATVNTDREDATVDLEIGDEDGINVSTDERSGVEVRSGSGGDNSLLGSLLGGDRNDSRNDNSGLNLFDNLLR